ncbi:hypothetical protein MTR67_044702 [Solanum verrucosum]|uniref:Uncharacterized protein n=1 Tax=Solanum verrucosum TaxID=315347 RepID=A0AAF0ZT50_SOLVR|nr:hypothetical protein MTR67_044702 [Solanum verrucosum]
MDHRLWMYNMHYEIDAGLKPEFIDGVQDVFFSPGILWSQRILYPFDSNKHTMTLYIFKNNGLVRYPCSAYVYNMVAPHGQIRVEQVRVEHDRIEHDRVHELINDTFGVQGGMEPKQYICDCDRHREHLGVSQTKQAKKKKSRRPIDLEDIAGSISFAPERINHDTHLFAIPFGTTDPRQYNPNYRRPVGASSTSHALHSRRYEDLPLQAIC